MENEMMTNIMKRILLVGLDQFLAFEILAQLGVHWRESTGELCDITLMLATFAGLIWAVLPSFPKMHFRIARVACRSLSIVLLFVAMYAVDYVHFWHLRPNLGLDREPDWAAEHPEFQKQMRERIRKNMWRSPNNELNPTTEGAPSVEG
jgi:hypothetical protein